ncbi:hypothetical protein TNCV_1500561 [Trichonephila clavipes]|nr:hypothetical protein TNCV_1500561 [Trichonephila clavipes]
MRISHKRLTIDNIRRVIADIRPQMLEKVIENWTSRLDYIRASRGSHMPEIIFKISLNDHARSLIARSAVRLMPSSIRMDSSAAINHKIRDHQSLFTNAWISAYDQLLTIISQSQRLVLK